MMKMFAGLYRPAPALIAFAYATAPLQAQSARPMLDYASAAAIRDGCLA